jgi:hypothetical protein
VSVWVKPRRKELLHVQGAVRSDRLDYTLYTRVEEVAEIGVLE